MDIKLLHSRQRAVCVLAIVKEFKFLSHPNLPCCNNVKKLKYEYMSEYCIIINTRLPLGLILLYTSADINTPSL